MLLLRATAKADQAALLEVWRVPGLTLSTPVQRAYSMTDTDGKAKTEAADAFEKLGVCRQLAVAAAELGWKTPTSIQEQAVPHLLAGKPGNLQV